MTATLEDNSLSVSMLRVAAEHLKQIKFPQLVRPAVGRDAPTTGTDPANQQNLEG